MSQQLIGLLSPRDCRFAVVEPIDTGNDASKTVSLDGNQIAIGDYLARFPSSAFIAFSNDDEVAIVRQSAEDQAYTLDFVLMLFDLDLSKSMKEKIASELEILLEDPENEKYVLDILLAQPFPASTEIESAVSAVEFHARCSNLFACISECQERSGFAFNAWLSIQSHQMIKQTGERQVLGNLIRSGIWRTLVTEFKTQADVAHEGGRLIIGGAMYCDPRVINFFKDAYSRQLPSGKNSQRSKELRRPIATQYVERSRVYDEPASATASKKFADEEQDRAIREVEEISRLYLEGDDTKARKFRDELTDRQSQEHDQSFMVKSLCNIASKCSTGGRRDIAAECLTEASTKSQGIDSRLFVQMGNLFKDLKKFDQAIECFTKANSLTGDANEIDSINRELSRMLTAKGEYPEALESFRRLSDIETSPYSRTSMATVLRRMGHLRESRRIYESVWAINPSHHQALLGLAETNRQFGRYEKAIRKYDFLLKTQDIDERSEKVYLMALSSLHCVSDRLGVSYSILDGLLNRYPLDPSLQLATAKVLRLQGENKRADVLFRQSFERLYQTEQLAAFLYETAIMNSGEAIATNNATPVVMPEFDGLWRCNSSLRNIIGGDFRAVLDNPQQTSHVYRLHYDFDALLQYHARLAIDPESSRVNDVAINRLRKRGLKELRLAVHSLDRNDFSQALGLEKRLCLKVA